MDKQLFKGQDPQVILDNLEGLADRIEKKTYVEGLSDAELTETKDIYIHKVMEIEREMEALAEIQNEYKERLKPVKDEVKGLMAEIRMGVREVEGKVYTIFNHDEGIAGEYTETGKLIKTRPILPTERQTTIKSMKAINS